MTEAEWLAAAQPYLMLRFLRDRGGASERKLRLFAVACCRRVWTLLTDERGRRAVEVAERFADRLAGDQERGAAAGGASPFKGSSNEGYPAQFACWSTCADESSGAAEVAAEWAAQVVAGANEGRTAWPVAIEANQAAQAALLRDIVGNPFGMAPSLAPAVLAWNNGTVGKLAAAIYEERAFDRLPVLADALEDAGCTDTAVLAHCRSGGEHVRGCWVVDLVLGKW
jgi:hypothetical protein